jgi:DeoR/GlpR family transcriptional regulator of sugar metabolism
MTAKQAPPRADDVDAARRGAVLAPQRQARILAEVERSGAVRVSELTRLLGVSDMTVRRDLDVLARRGLLAKVHGGATAVDQETSTDEPGFEAKRVRELAEKEAIAQRAAELVSPHAAVALTAGTTTWSLAARLGDVPNLTVVTNSIPVADLLHRQHRPDLTVILTGGIRTPSDALVGPVAVATIRSLHVDLVFMGVHGIDARAGLTTPNLMEAETNQAFVRSARRLVVVADHTKWGVVGLSEIAPLDSVDTLVTDDRLEPDARATLADHVREVVVATPDPRPNGRSTP